MTKRGMDFFMGRMKTRNPAAVKESGMEVPVASTIEEMTRRARLIDLAGG